MPDVSQEPTISRGDLRRIVREAAPLWARQSPGASGLLDEAVDRAKVVAVGEDECGGIGCIAKQAGISTGQFTVLDAALFRSLNLAPEPTVVRVVDP